VNQVFDRVNTTATVWLGTTLECAQCHNHKYDPFTLKDYYRLFAFFNQSEQETAFTSPKAMAALRFTGPYLDLPPSEAEAAARAGFTVRLASLDERIAARRPALLTGFAAWQQQVDSASVPAAIAAVLRVDSARRNAAQRARLEAHFLGLDPELAALQEERRALEKQRPPPAVRTLVMRDVATPRPTRVLRRGNFLDPGEEIESGTPEVLHPFRRGATANRLDLARWLVSRENPLVARVTVNRWWAELFGRGDALCPHFRYFHICQRAIGSLQAQAIGQAARIVAHSLASINVEQRNVNKQIATCLPKGLHQVGGRHTIGNNECQVEIARWIFAHHLRRLWLWNFVQHDRKVHFQTGNAPNYSGISQHRWIDFTD
jgi:hypothetical protein